MPAELLDRLDAWKHRYDLSDKGLDRLLAAVAKARFHDAGELIRLHETLLFLRAYPRSTKVARLADAILFSFGKRIVQAGVDDARFEEPEVSGIAGTSLSAVFDYEVAQSLALRHPRDIEIAWDRYDETHRFGPAASRILPLLSEDWPVEAHVPYRQWVSAALPPGTRDLSWLLERVAHLPLGPRAQSELYGTLELPLTWRMGRSPVSRSRLRLPGRRLYCHREPLLRRGDVSLARELDGPPLPLRRLPRPEAGHILDTILDTSAMRYRELYGFSHPDEAGVFHADAGRGVEIFFFGLPPAWRLPLRAYHAGMIFKNGVPAGYVEVLSLFERAEVGFNLYYTFREGESAWIYARLLRLFRQMLGVNCFSVDPYQIGLENPEAVDSGAFWFYRKLGFRPAEPAVTELVGREERRMRKTPGYRSSKRTLERLAEGYILYEGPGAEPGAWDQFRVREVGLAVQRAVAQRFAGDMEGFRRTAERRIARTLGIESSSGLALTVSLIPALESWTKEEKQNAARILAAKERAGESRYLQLMQRHPRLRAGFLALASPHPPTR